MSKYFDSLEESKSWAQLRPEAFSIRRQAYLTDLHHNNGSHKFGNKGLPRLYHRFGMAQAADNGIPFARGSFNPYHQPFCSNLGGCRERTSARLKFTVWKGSSFKPPSVRPQGKVVYMRVTLQPPLRGCKSHWGKEDDETPLGLPRVLRAWVCTVLKAAEMGSKIPPFPPNLRTYLPT